MQKKHLAWLIVGVWAVFLSLYTVRPIAQNIGKIEESVILKNGTFFKFFLENG